MNRRKSKTCIAICKLKSGQLVMAGDRRVSMEDGTIYKCPNPKIRRSWNGILTGASGESALCKTVVDLFEPPEMKVDDLDLYMNYEYIPSLYRCLRNIPGYIDEHKQLRLAPNEACSILLGIQDKVYTIDIYSPVDDLKPFNYSRVVFDDAPIPFSIGCGANSAMPVLIDEVKTKGYNTKQGLTKALQVAADLNSGCDNQIDIISTEN